MQQDPVWSSQTIRRKEVAVLQWPLQVPSLRVPHIAGSCTSFARRYRRQLEVTSAILQWQAKVGAGRSLLRFLIPKEGAGLPWQLFSGTEYPQLAGQLWRLSEPSPHLKEEPPNFVFYSQLCRYSLRSLFKRVAPARAVLPVTRLTCFALTVTRLQWHACVDGLVPPLPDLEI